MVAPTERMDIFRLLYGERRKPSAIAAAPNRKPSGATREPEKGVGKGYNPTFAEARRLEARRGRRLKMSGGAWNTVKPPLEKRRSPEKAAERLEKERPCYATPGKTICGCIFFHMKRGVEKAGVAGRPPAAGKEGAGGRGGMPEMTLTDTRPAEANAGEASGRWEGGMGKRRFAQGESSCFTHGFPLKNAVLHTRFRQYRPKLWLLR
ncbi:MAG: hypothetical protein LBL45_09410 [Treponema sp.]|nr:hypothetical protein [Treponema sp.]